MVGQCPSGPIIPSTHVQGLVDDEKVITSAVMPSTLRRNLIDDEKVITSAVMPSTLRRNLTLKRIVDGVTANNTKINSLPNTNTYCDNLNKSKHKNKLNLT